MFFSAATVVLAAAGLASAAPAVQKRAAPQINDGVILNYALTLEHLEDNFYREGLSMFKEKDFADAGYDSTFYNNIKKVSSDETTHVDFITKALKGSSHVPPPNMVVLLTILFSRRCHPR